MKFPFYQPHPPKNTKKRFDESLTMKPLSSSSTGTSLTYLGFKTYWVRPWLANEKKEILNMKIYNIHIFKQALFIMRNKQNTLFFSVFIPLCLSPALIFNHFLNHFTSSHSFSWKWINQHDSSMPKASNGFRMVEVLKLVFPNWNILWLIGKIMKWTEF